MNENSAGSEHGPLSGIRVIDFTSYQAGALVGQMLGDMGAEVIKVEPPVRGDASRTGLEPVLGDDSAYFLSLNRNKRSVAADLKNSEGREVVRRLVGNSDVLLENQRPGGMSRFGLDYESLHAEYPSLVYASVTGYGLTGPSAHDSALDPAIQARGGMMSITGPNGGEPLVVGSNLSGTAASALCYGAIVTALFTRFRTGMGQRVSVSLLDATLMFLRSRESHYFATGEVPGRVGNVNRYMAPMEVFETADGFLQLSIQHDYQWLELCEVLEAPDLAADERYIQNADRLKRQPELSEELAPYLRQRTTAEWHEIFVKHKIMCEPIQNLAEVFEDPQVIHNEMVLEIEHPTAGIMRMLGIPQKLSETPGRVRTPPPLRGADTVDVLRTILGMEEDEIVDLQKAGAIEVPS